MVDAAGSHAAGSLVCAPARQMEYRKKTRFEPANESVEAGFRYVFYYSCLS